jgi:hypothetical protein
LRPWLEAERVRLLDDDGLQRRDDVGSEFERAICRTKGCRSIPDSDLDDEEHSGCERGRSERVTALEWPSPPKATWQAAPADDGDAALPDLLDDVSRSLAVPTVAGAGIRHTLAAVMAATNVTTARTNTFRSSACAIQCAKGVCRSAPEG